jgi:hypothetical protein
MRLFVASALAAIAISFSGGASAGSFFGRGAYDAARANCDAAYYETRQLKTMVAWARCRNDALDVYMAGGDRNPDLTQLLKVTRLSIATKYDGRKIDGLEAQRQLAEIETRYRSETETRSAQRRRPTASPAPDLGPHVCTTQVFTGGFAQTLCY